MRPSAPAGFILGWVGLSLLFEAGRWAYAWEVTPRLGLEWGTWLWAVEFAAYAGVVSVAEAFCQSRLLSRFGRPVRRWTGVVGIGTWAVSVLMILAYWAFMRRGGVVVGPWGFAASEISQETAWTLATGVVMGVAARGRRWDYPWMLWITARSGAALAAGVVGMAGLWDARAAGIRVDYNGLRGAQEGMSLVVVDGATAWLLWRYVLPNPSAEPVLSLGRV